MKYVLLLTLVIIPQIAMSAAELPSASAWFTDAVIENSTRIVNTAGDYNGVLGGFGKSVLLSKPVPVDDPLLDQANGMISFWLRPEWNGNDGKTHRILKIGDPARNGLLIEKSAKGMLRYVMASPKETTAARADVSKWKAGEWHYITVVWFSRNGRPLGMPLWIDKVCVDGPIASGNDFLNPGAMTDKRVWIGDSTSNAVMDELTFRKELTRRGSWGLADIIYRDYFRTAPYTKIIIDPDASAVPSDRRVVNGCQKPFGMKASLNGKWERITENVEGYGNWTDFDAKSYIKWSSSDEKIATVDNNGIVTGKSVGKCLLTAEFHGMKSTYNLNVIPIEQPDIDLYCVERLPRYSSMREKQWPIREKM